MVKKFSRKSVRFFAIACLTLAVVCLWTVESANTASYTAVQRWTVNGPLGSGICAFNFNTQTWTCFPSPGGSPYTVNYSLPNSLETVGFFLYDVTTPNRPQVFQKAIYLVCQNCQ